MLVRWTKPAADDLTLISDYTQEHFGGAQASRAADSMVVQLEADGLERRLWPAP